LIITRRSQARGSRFYCNGSRTLRSRPPTTGRSCFPVRGLLLTLCLLFDGRPEHPRFLPCTSKYEQPPAHEQYKASVSTTRGYTSGAWSSKKMYTERSHVALWRRAKTPIEPRVHVEPNFAPHAAPGAASDRRPLWTLDFGVRCYTVTWASGGPCMLVRMRAARVVKCVQMCVCDLSYTDLKIRGFKMKAP
jgi:hypothetical protein